MASTSEPIQIGPFVGGLNTYSDPTAVEDNQVVQCINFEPDLDGSLVSRPPVMATLATLPLGATGNVRLLGTFYGPAGTPYVIASDGLSSTYYYTGTSWSLITNTLAAQAMVQFNDKAWMLAPAGSANPGGSWSPGGTFTAEPNMPKGDSIVALKNRLWVAVGREADSNGTRMYFSKVLGQTPFWQVAPDFIDVGSGDGQNIVSLLVYFNNLVIFRTRSIYTFQYTSDPSSGVISQIVPGVGLNDARSATVSDDRVYFMYQDRAYEFYNNRARQINIQVPFKSRNRVGIYSPYSVSMFNNRVMFQYWDATFVYHLKTQTWTTWESIEHSAFGQFYELERTSDARRAIVFGARAVPTGGTRAAPTLVVEDTVGSAHEHMICTLQTKNYDYEASSVYKRLFWWGANAVFRGEVRAIATPITYNYSITWGQLLSTTWSKLLDYTWGQPLSGTLEIQTDQQTAGSGSMRKFVKFLKGARFRQINFKVVFDTDGSIGTAPVRLFSLMTYVRAKEKVSKTVT